MIMGRGRCQNSPVKTTLALFFCNVTTRETQDISIGRSYLVCWSYCVTHSKVRDPIIFVEVYPH